MFWYIKNFINKYILVMIFLLIWELVARLKIFSPVFLPSFSKVILTIIKMENSGELFGNIGISLLMISQSRCMIRRRRYELRQVLFTSLLRQVQDSRRA